MEQEMDCGGDCGSCARCSQGEYDRRQEWLAEMDAQHNEKPCEVCGSLYPNTAEYFAMRDGKRTCERCAKMPNTPVDEDYELPF